jgi:transcriptional regulator with XRE-family HTH domain
MSNKQKTITSEQFRQATADIKSASGVNLSVADIAEGTGLSKAYVSEFRNDTRNLTTAQQVQLRTYLDGKCAEYGLNIAEQENDVEMPKIPGQFAHYALKPSLSLSDTIPEKQRNAILSAIEKLDQQICALLPEKVETTMMGNMTDETEEKLEKIFAACTLGYIAFRTLQGRNIVERVDPEAKPNTLADVVSHFFNGSPLLDLLPFDMDGDDALTDGARKSSALTA